MPFKSEAQRKFLWANKPEIAKEWTKEYGSKIQAKDGANLSQIEATLDSGVGDLSATPGALTIVARSQNVNTQTTFGGNLEMASLHGNVVISSGPSLGVNETQVRVKNNFRLDAKLIDGSGNTGGQGAALTSDAANNKVKWGPALTVVELEEDAGSIVDSNGDNWDVTVNQNAIVGTITGSADLSIDNVSDGLTGTFVFTLGNTGEVNWPANSLFEGGAPTLSAGTHVAAFIYIDGNYYWSVGQDFSA